MVNFCSANELGVTGITPTLLEFAAWHSSQLEELASC